MALIRLLLSHGANVNAQIKKNPPRFGTTVSAQRLVGATPFVLASMSCDVPIMELLLANGANRSLTTPNNMTPLMMAAGFGRTPGEYRATEAACLEATTFLLDAGADIHEANAAGDTAMHAAAYGANNTIVKLLLARGARLNDRNKAGQTPMKMALGTFIYGTASANFHSNPETAELLRTLGGIE
jgi:ankyrin repeat protein